MVSIWRQTYVTTRPNAYTYWCFPRPGAAIRRWTLKSAGYGRGVGSFVRFEQKEDRSKKRSSGEAIIANHIGDQEEMLT